MHGGTYAVSLACQDHQAHHTSSNGYTRCPEKNATLFLTITLASLSHFHYFCTIANRNEYSTITCHLIT